MAEQELTGTKKDGRRVLVAVDHSEISEKAFQWFMENVYRSNDDILICHIPEIPDLCSFSFKRYLENVHKDGDQVIISHIPEAPHLHSVSLKAGLKLPFEQWQQSLQDANDKVEKLHEHYKYLLQNKNIRKFECLGEHHKKPGEGILRIASEKQADLIVIGTRGLDKMDRLLMGSVSSYVVHRANIPVIICPMGQSH